MEILEKIALVFTIVGALNWGLIGLLDFNLVSMLFGADSMLSNLVYIIVGVCGIINIGLFFSHYLYKK